MMKRTNLKFTFCALLLLVLSGTAFGQRAETQDWFVADKQVNCVGVAPQKCLVVREVNSPDWSYFYSSIAGFNFRDGYTQKIRVQIASRQNAPADASALNYRLVRVLSRSKTDGNTLEEAQAQMKNRKPIILDGRKWMLTEIEGEKVAVENAFIEFNARERRFSSKVCNGMGGSYQQNGSKLKFSRVVGTMMACPEPINSIETKFRNALEKVTAVDQQTDRLVLLAGNKPVLVFEAEVKNELPSKTLAGTRWALVGIEGEKITPKGRIPFLLLDTEKRTFAGNSGCNNLFGKYETSGSTVRFSGVGMTKMACLAPEVQTIETRMTAALPNVNRYEIKNGVLNLYADGKLLLKLMSLGR
jgi:heat shock protein HslJ